MILQMQESMGTYTDWCAPNSVQLITELDCHGRFDRRSGGIIVEHEILFRKIIQSCLVARDVQVRVRNDAPFFLDETVQELLNRA